MKILCSLFSLITISSSAQIVSNVNASINDGRVTITYDLAGNSVSDKFNVKCFYSTNDGQSYPTELVTASGAVGAGQSSGAGKKIVWDVKKDLLDFDGSLKFKVHASVPENYVTGKTISIQLTKLLKMDDRKLALQGYLFGIAKHKMSIQLSSIIRDTGGRSYKLVGGKIDNQQISSDLEVAEGDTHFFDLLFTPLSGEALTNSITMDLVFFVFNDERISMQGLNIKVSK